MKRNCRRDTEEKAIHEKAVRLRKMTDAQICEFIDHTYQRGVSEGAELAAARRHPPTAVLRSESSSPFWRAVSAPGTGSGRVLFST